MLFKYNFTSKLELINFFNITKNIKLADDIYEENLLPLPIKFYNTSDFTHSKNIIAAFLST